MSPGFRTGTVNSGLAIASTMQCLASLLGQQFKASAGHDNNATLSQRGEGKADSKL